MDGQIIINDVSNINRYGAFYDVEITDIVGYDLVGHVVLSGE